MKAVVYKKYGPPSSLKIQELEKPIPGKNEVLIKVRATTINDYDWGSVRGKPYLYRLLFGLTGPKRSTPGMELAGTIEALGPEASLFEVGDAVYGDISEFGWGSWAEYVCTNEKALVIKPDNMSFEEASSIPHAFELAYQGLVDIGDIKQNQKILINGAGGGVGTLGLQIAKTFGAEVTGVDTGDKLKTMRSMGFDHVIDYKMEDFTRNGELYNLILDAKTTKSPFAYLMSLAPKGKYATVGGYLSRILQLLLCKRWISTRHKKSVHLVALEPNKNLGVANKLFGKGLVKPVIDGPYTMEDIPQVLQYFGDGKHTGKVVISIPDQ